MRIYKCDCCNKECNNIEYERWLSIQTKDTHQQDIHTKIINRLGYNTLTHSYSHITGLHLCSAECTIKYFFGEKFANQYSEAILKDFTY